MITNTLIKHCRIIVLQNPHTYYIYFSVILCSLYDCVCSSFIVNFSFCHHLIDIHLYKFFTCLGVNKICLNHIF